MMMYCSMRETGTNGKDVGQSVVERYMVMSG